MHAFDVVRRHDAYQRVGIPELWLISDDCHDQAVLVCRQTRPSSSYRHVELGGSDVVTSPLLEGFEMKVSELFAR